jgi:hypothetical protein
VSDGGQPCEWVSGQAFPPEPFVDKWVVTIARSQIPVERA